MTLADASGTVTVLLDMPEMNTVAKVRAMSRAAEVEQDLLVIDDYSSNNGETATINIKLENSYEYVALQADIVLPEGMSLLSVDTGDRAANHSLMTKQINANTTRIVLFDLDNDIFVDNDESLLSLKVTVNSSTAGDIIINNALVSDSQANEYMLKSTGGHNSVLTGVTDVNYGTVDVITENGEIKVLNAVDHEIAVYAVDGTILNHRIAKSNNESIRMDPGVYVVTVGEYVTKVVVK